MAHIPKMSGKANLIIVVGQISGLAAQITQQISLGLTSPQAHLPATHQPEMRAKQASAHHYWVILITAMQQGPSAAVAMQVHMNTVQHLAQGVLVEKLET